METCKGIKKSWPTRVSTAKGKKLETLPSYLNYELEDFSGIEL
jgi:hypothetical protein